MPKSKKETSNSSKRRSKKEEDDEEQEVEIEENESKKKSTSKKPSKTSAKSKKSDKSDKSDKPDKTGNDSEDDLSDLDVDEEVSQLEITDNDEVVVSQKPERPPRKLIDPSTPIGQLNTQDILSYLIKIGEDNLNPQLRFGALNLLQQLTGGRRRPAYGSKSGRFEQNKSQNQGPPQGFGRGMNMASRGRGRPNQQQRQSAPVDVYGDMD